jgi:hypothetical protein
MAEPRERQECGACLSAPKNSQTKKNRFRERVCRTKEKEKTCDQTRKSFERNRFPQEIGQQ